MPLQASTHAIHTQGSLRGRRFALAFVPRRFSKSRERSASQRGVWGSVPPDTGSAHTSKTRTPQVLIAYRLATPKRSQMGFKLATWVNLANETLLSQHLNRSIESVQMGITPDRIFEQHRHRHRPDSARYRRNPTRHFFD